MDGLWDKSNGQACGKISFQILLLYQLDLEKQIEIKVENTQSPNILTVWP